MIADLEERSMKTRDCTLTVPLPHVALHCPPLKLIQFRCPQGPTPTFTMGSSWTHILKSSWRFGVGRSSGEGIQLSGDEDCDVEAMEVIVFYYQGKKRCSIYLWYK